MAQSLSVIQQAVQWESRDESITISSGNELAMVNSVYRRLCALYPWNELTREDTSLTTTGGTASYTFPSSPVFIDLQKVEMQDIGDNSDYKIVAPARDELDWTLVRNKQPSFPQLYRRMHNGTNHLILFAPTPVNDSQTIRLTGLVEPTALANSSSTTIFLMNTVDEVFALLIAANILDKREFPERAVRLVQQASEILGQVIGREIQPKEMQKVVNG